MSARREIAIVVSETHWDREWYQPFQEFRFHLVGLARRLVEILQARPDYRAFVFDGQTVVIPDILEVAPELEEPLRELACAGRIRFGPWYVLPDEFLVSAESLVRNLHYGHRLAERFGGTMKIGYVPDGFGHPAQLPQVLAGFGIRHAVMWRGMGEEAEDLGSEFWWEALDGSQVLTVWMPRGYGNFANVGFPVNWGDVRGYEPSIEEADGKLRQQLSVLRKYSRCGVFLLMNGLDHLPPQAELPDLLFALRRMHREIELRHGTFEDLFEAIESRLGLVTPLKVYQGEFNSGKHAAVLQGVYSTRIYLKQANFELETKLVHYVEPLVALGLLFHGDPGWRGFVDYAWRELMKNHPHDDICGCSVDTVHRNNEHVYEQVRQVVGKLEGEILHHLGWQIDLKKSEGTPFVVWNPAEFERGEWTEVELWFDGSDEIAHSFRLVLSDGKEIPFVRLGERIEEGLDYLTPFRKRVVKGLARLPAVPPMGWQTFYAVRGSTTQPKGSLRVDKKRGEIENEFLLLSVNEDGTFNLEDKSTGNRFENLHWLEDTEDVGDEYDYSPAENSLTLDTRGSEAEIEIRNGSGLVAEVLVRRRWDLPECFDRDRGRRSSRRVPVEITTSLRVWQGSPRVDIETVVDNRVRDHRLRVHFPTGIVTDFADVDEQFAIIHRRIALPLEKDPVQPPVPTRHFQRFVSLGRNGRGFAVVARGLHEYQVLDDGELAITLFRSVGWLSRGDLLTRKGNAGWSIPTPEAQCLRKMKFEYAILPHSGDVRSDVVRNRLMAFLLPVRVSRANWVPSLGFDLPKEERPIKADPVFERARCLPERGSVVRIEGEGVMLSSLKPAWRSQGMVVRVYSVNHVSTDVVLTWQWPLRRVFEVNLNEEYKATLEHNGNAFGFRIRPNQIRTFLVVPELSEIGCKD